MSESKQNDGGPAFPLQSIGPDFSPGYAGMSLRDKFADSALPACIMKCVPHEVKTGETMAEMFARKAYEVADAMLAERAKATRHE